MSSAKRILIVLAACQILWLPTASAQAPRQTTPASRADAVAKLSKQLRWNDEPSHQRYLAARDQVTQQLLGEIDGFISDNFQPSTATAAQVKTGLDSLLGYKAGDVMRDVSFSVGLPRGRFLIAGIELWRGGGNFAEDAVSFRAYRRSGDKFALVAHTEDLHSSDAENPYLYCFYGEALPNAPAVGEFWFMASADVNDQAPPMVAIRLLAFDGEKFRAVWAPRDVMAVSVVTEGAESAVQFTSGGFTVNKLSDPTGMAAHSPTVVIHEQYTLAADGPHMVREWKTPRQ
jgi:hypothetical protein